MTLADKLNKCIEDKELTNYKIAKDLGVSASTIANYRNGETVPDSEKLKRLANYLGLSLDYLLDNVGAIVANSQAFYNERSEKSIPYYPDVNASAGLDFLTNNGHNYSLPIKIPNVDAQAFINVFGDSMYPKYCSGEIIGVKEIEKDMVFPGHAYVIQTVDGEAYIKYVDPGKDEEHWILRSENEKYKSKQMHLSKIRRVFIIKAVITKSTLL